METSERKLSSIQPYHKNAKEHPEKQVKKIAASIKEFGFNQPIVVDKEGVIIVGHGRYLAAHLLGIDPVPVLELDLNEEQVRAYRLADNKLNESDWDDSIVISELKLLSPKMIDLTGFDSEEIEGLASADEISQLARERDIDLGKYNVMTVEAPEAPRLKARMSFYFDSVEEFEAAKRYFKLKGGELDTKKLMDLVVK